MLINEATSDIQFECLDAILPRLSPVAKVPFGFISKGEMPQPTRANIASARLLTSRKAVSAHQKQKWINQSRSVKDVMKPLPTEIDMEERSFSLDPFHLSSLIYPKTGYKPENPDIGRPP
jgi:hypothetical protein